MGLPLYDAAARTSQVTSGQPIVALLPAAAALGTGRILRVKQIAISNTTATAFGIAIGIATAAGTTPGGASTPQRRSNTVGAIDPAATAQGLYTTYGTQPTAPSFFNQRLWIPGSSLVVWTYADGEELIVPPNATPLPLCVWLTSTGQLADVSISWEE